MIKISCKEVRAEIEKIRREITELEEILKGFPKGELSCSKNDTRYKWYLREDSKTVYLPKGNRGFAEKLAVKKYYENKLAELQNELVSYEYYLRHMAGVEGKAEAMLYHQEWSKLLANHFEADTAELKNWVNEEYEHCKKYSENLIFKGTQGKMLRSKSEVIIDMLLYKYHIPFRYEAKLELCNEIEIYPDFTMRHPQNGKIIYWEHFGLMDDEVYRNNACNKIRLYCENNIIPSVNLIATFETKNYPLDIGHVESIIKEYFLS